MLKLAKKIAPLPDWSRKFNGPIPIQNGSPLHRLCDAAQFILALPKAEQQATAWQAAAEVLKMIAERGGPTMMARIAMLKALHHHKPQAKTTRRHARKYTIIR